MTPASGQRQLQVKSTLIMLAIALFVTSAAFWTLYGVVLRRTEVQLVELAESQARLMEAVAKYDALRSENGRVGRAATLSQIRESHFRYRGFGETGEIVLGERLDSTIHFLLPEPSLGFEVPPPVALGGAAALPMALAISGESGVVRGEDFRGVEVLAAYRHLPFLGLGLVTKMDMAEIRSPFFQAALITGGFALLALLLGGALQQRLVNPVLSDVFLLNRELAEREQKLSRLSTQLSRYLSPQLYRSMFEGGTEARIFTQRKKLTVFFSDVVGFTARADSMEPEDLSHQLNTYFDAMARLVHKHGGTLDKFVGDALLVFFGDPESRGVQEDAIACVEMAWEMRQVIRELDERWASEGLRGDFEVRMGVATGFCTVGNFGSESRMEYTIIGNQVNLASRFETNALPGEILLSQDTYRLVRARFECIEREPVEAKGFSAPIPSFQVLGPLGAERSNEVDEGSGAVMDAARPGFSLQFDPSAMDPGDRPAVLEELRAAIDALEKEVRPEDDA